MVGEHENDWLGSIANNYAGSSSQVKGFVESVTEGYKSCNRHSKGHFLYDPSLLYASSSLGDLLYRIEFGSSDLARCGHQCNQRCNQYELVSTKQTKVLPGAPEALGKPRRGNVTLGETERSTTACIAKSQARAVKRSLSIGVINVRLLAFDNRQHYPLAQPRPKSATRANHTLYSPSPSDPLSSPDDFRVCLRGLATGLQLGSPRPGFHDNSPLGRW